MKNSKTVRLTELSLFIAIILVMKITGLTNIAIGPFYMTFSMIPIAIGAMLLGPFAGAALGAVYGFTSLYDAVTGASAMTGLLFQLFPVKTVILCVGMRTLVGLFTGLLFKALFKIDKTKTVCYYAGGLAAPLLNTLLFMGFIVLCFYHTDVISQKVQALGATGPITYIILSVGVQGVIEAVTGSVLGGTIAKATDKIVKNRRV